MLAEKKKRPPREKAPAAHGSAIESFKAMTTGVSGTEWLRQKGPSK